MSHLQRPPHTVPHSVPANQCLTGCLYQVVQTTGLQGSNVLKLLPILKPKDNALRTVPPPLIPSAPILNVPRAVLSSPLPPPPPPPVSILSRPSPVSVPLVQTPALGNYIIAAPNNLANTLHIENTFSLAPETNLFRDNGQLTLPGNSVPTSPTFIMMNKKVPTPVKPAATLPAGHSLQIPAHAEVLSMPVSSLPFSIQQKILPQPIGTDAGKIPSVIYVSPVNTVKSNSGPGPVVYQSPNISSVPLKPPAGQKPPTSASDSLKGPMKWVVQESQESNAHLVPVKSANDTASKILQMLSKTKMEDVNISSPDHSKVVQIKDNALVMCNNKIFFLTKKGTELMDAGSKKVEPPPYTSPVKAVVQNEPVKDLSNKVVQVVLSKNKSPPPPSAEQSVQSNVVSTAKPKRKSSTPRPAREDPDIIYIPDDDEEGCSDVSVKPRETPGGPTEAVNKVAEKKYDQLILKSERTEIPTSLKALEANVMDDQGWRLRFGLLKKEKIVLKRIPLIQAASASTSDSCPQEAAVDPAESQQLKRMSLSVQAEIAPKKQKSTEDDNLDYNAKNPERSSDSPVPGGISPETTERSSPTYYGGEAFPPPDSSSLHQDVTGHFSEVSLPHQRYHSDAFSMFPDETTNDEKIQRLKEVLKEREKALEAVRQKTN